MNPNYKSFSNPSDAFAGCAEAVHWPRKPMPGPAKGAKATGKTGKSNSSKVSKDGRNSTPTHGKVKRNSFW
jgi:hypothetical protein